jgi:hypothetical protein
MRQGFAREALVTSRGRHLLKRSGLAACLAALSLGSSSTAGATVTIGQTGTPTTTCASGNDRLQPTVTGGNAYVVPPTVVTGMITSWSTEASASAGQMLTLKVFRPLGGATYQVVGHDGPHTLTGGALNTFPASIPVKAGDVLGSSIPAAEATGCNFVVPGDSYLFHEAELAEGESGDFTNVQADRRLDISAVVDPSNSFNLGAITRNKKKGTATLTATVPNRGEFTGSGKGVKIAGAAGAVTSKNVTAPGAVKLTIKAKGKKKRKLNDTGKVEVKPRITYTPTGGDPATQSIKVKLIKKL